MREDKKKKPQKPSPKFVGKSCELCGRKYEPHHNTGKYPRFITHHLRYPDPAKPDEPEITAVVCLSCHNWMSGNGRVYNHVLKSRNMTPEERAAAPFLFAAAVVDLYSQKLIVPEINKALAERGRVVVADAATAQMYKRNTTH